MPFLTLYQVISLSLSVIQVIGVAVVGLLLTVFEVANPDYEIHIVQVSNSGETERPHLLRCWLVNNGLGIGKFNGIRRISTDDDMDQFMDRGGGFRFQGDIIEKRIYPKFPKLDNSKLLFISCSQIPEEGSAALVQDEKAGELWTEISRKI